MGPDTTREPNEYRSEHDSMGPLQVPAHALWGASTQRAVDNFPISGEPLPGELLRALALIKAGYAEANRDLGLLEPAVADAIASASQAIADGAHHDQFPVDVFQTGSGTSSNMNANEVIAHLASEAAGRMIHPNDHVNAGQSSNDVFPGALQVAACLAIADDLRPALEHLATTIEQRAAELDAVVKTGRTHLMDAMPVTLGQELTTWARQLRSADARLADTLPRLACLPLGGTAVGTGVNAHPELGTRVCTRLAEASGLPFRAMNHPFEGIGAQDNAVEASGQVKTVAVALMKIANDLRWMNSGPLAGLGEIALPALQPGSSIMPGKVNPVIPEAVAQVAAQIIGNDAAVTIGGQSGNFQLNVMLPMMARNLMESIRLAAAVSRVLADRAIAGFTVNDATLRAALERNPILVTALNPVIGYEKGAAIAKRAYAEGRPLLAVALEETDLPEDELRRLLDPARLTDNRT